MPNTARHAFGALENIQSALQAGTINAHDVLFVKDANGKPYVGWIDKDGQPVIVNETDEVVRVDALPTAGEEGKIYIFGEDGYFWDGEKFINLCKPTDVSNLENKIDEIESNLDVVTNESQTHEKVKFEISDVPVGTLINYLKEEIRVMCPADAEYHLQSVGTNGNSNTYYMTFKTYCYDDNVVGYREHINGQSDATTLTDLKTDSYGRKYQPTWLGIANYDASTGTWTYNGANSSVSHYIGWDYRIDWYNADGIVIASDSIRINLSNEDCHFSTEPYYINETKNYTDQQINLIMESMTVVEF